MRKWLRENRGLVVFLLGLAFVRTALADWNPIPSGSMRPTLLEGDVVLVNRVAYDLKLPLTDVVLVPLAAPRRGDIVTFSSPADGTRLIKRIVGLPGDTIEMREAALFVNGERCDYGDARLVAEPGVAAPVLRLREDFGQRAHQVQYIGHPQARHDFGPLRVPPESVFVMGDNRDNSADSRVFGPVPRQRLIGRAHRLLVSYDLIGSGGLRFARFGQALD